MNGGAWRSSASAPGSVGTPERLDVAESQAAALLTTGWSTIQGSIQSTWREVIDKAERVEKEHFKGDLLKAVGEATIAAGQAVGEASREAAGRLSATAPVIASQLTFEAKPSEPSSEDLIDQAAQIQKELKQMRESNGVRAADLRDVADRIEALGHEVMAEQELLSRSSDERADADAESDEAWRGFEELQEHHHNLLSRKVKLEAELRRAHIDADLAARAAKQARNEGDWAREGPETEALMEAKLCLAQLLTELDEARLQERRELFALQKQIEEATNIYNSLLRKQPARDSLAEADMLRDFGAR